MNGPGYSTLIIDLSNVCRDQGLAPVGRDAEWSRLQLLLRAIDRDGGIDYSSYYLVADRSLRGRLDSAARRELSAAESAGQLEQRGFADDRLVEITFGADPPFRNPLLVSNDFFDDFRRSFPELNQATAIAWTADAGGMPRPALRPFGARTHHRMSRKEEEGELRRRRLQRKVVQDEAARWYYQCTSDQCVIASFWPDHLEELPQYDQDGRRFVCPSCRSELTRGRERNAAVQVIVYEGDREVARLLVESGIEIGRVDAPRCIGLDRFLSPNVVAAVSRRHLRLYVDGERVILEDLGSKNGTVLRPRMEGRQDTNVVVGSKVSWGLRDAVVLPGDVRLERSGRRLPYSGEGTLTEPPVPESSETRMINRRSKS